ncbi:hypothetical protein [Streptomyces sp. NPDC047042]|uniref:hypothetical protein n=1 Tax=Streptomyces sp. NPDC047042 TaxID=3154807 RepID=UPI003402BE66
MPTLPHDLYLSQVTDALAAAGLEPTESWTDDGELDRYRDDDLSGAACMLNAVLNWDDDHPALDASKYRHGITLMWDHPAEQWQWAPRKENGHLQHDPTFLTSLPRWVDPAVVVIVVRDLLAGRPAPTSVSPLWTGAEAAQHAVDAWTGAEEAKA